MKNEEQKKPVLIGSIILLVFIVIGLCFLYNWYTNSVNYLETDDASIEGNHVSISSKMLGRVYTLLVDEGAQVKAGQLLVKLDDSDLRAQEAQLNASLNYAKQNLILAKVNLDKAQDDFDRTKTLYETAVGTKEQYDHASKALEAAKAQYAISQAQIETAKSQLGVIQTQLLNTQILAPISGVIAKRLVMPGEVVQPGQAIYSINDLTHLWITANFEETKIRLIKPHQFVKITVDAYPNQQFKGEVSQIGTNIVPPPFSIGESTKTTQKIPIKILFKQIPNSVTFVPGLSVEVKIRTH